jgi:uncharacterized membrane protein YkvA (DUF1232 family)
MSQGDIEHSGAHPDKERELLGWLKEFLAQFVLAWKLLWDSRVSWVTKLLPFSVLAYLILPFDIVPDALIGLGQVDDLVLILVGLRMFISLCPPEVVAELQGPEQRRAEDSWHTPVEEIIDLEVKMPPAQDVEDHDKPD